MLQKFDHHNFPYLAVDEKRSDLGERLAVLQRKLLETKKSVLILIDGWESSGKGSVTMDLIRDLDPRYYQVFTFDQPSSEARVRPFLWRFFRRLPRYGRLAIFSRSLYFDLLDNQAMRKRELTDRCRDIAYFERLLVDDGTLVLKFFMDQSRDTMKGRVKALRQDPNRAIFITKHDEAQLQDYNHYRKHFSRVLNRTHTDDAPWEVISAEDTKAAARHLLRRTIDRLEAHLEKPGLREHPLPTNPARPLEELDLSPALSLTDYTEQIRPLQIRARDLLNELYTRRRSVVVVFEGIDAAGKGGSIRNLAKFMDPRGYTIATTAAPDATENQYHYLWRFYRDLPEAGKMTIYDRSWYGRVLVERIEGLAKTHRWLEAYDEINAFEDSLCRSGLLLIKFLLVIDPDEQAARFQARLDDPAKRHKITEEDWRNRDKADEYRKSMNDMVNETSTPERPWHLIPANDKRYARIAVLRTFIREVSDWLDM